MALPPIKKQRLQNNNETTIFANTDTMHIFQWNEKNINLLMYGYTRNNINFGIPDICSIIYIYLFDLLLNYHISNSKYCNLKYLSNNNIICNFNMHGNDIIYLYNQSMIIFTPYLSFVFNNINKTNNITRIIRKMKCQLITNNCQEKEFILQCGIIGIPKNDSSYNLKHIKNVIENSQYFSSSVCDARDDLSLCNIMFQDGLQCFRNCITHFVAINKFGTWYGYNFYDNHTLLDTYDNKFNINNINDTIEVCIKYNTILKDYKCYFVQNNTLIGTNIVLNNACFENGKITIDFQNYDYLFALSSRRCDCKQFSKCNGIEYKLSITNSFE